MGTLMTKYLNIWENNFLQMSEGRTLKAAFFTNSKNPQK